MVQQQRSPILHPSTSTTYNGGSMPNSPSLYHQQQQQIDNQQQHHHPHHHPNGCKDSVDHRSSVDESSTAQTPIASTKWKKVLYEPQPYPDNYTDETFLKELIQNANFIKYDFWKIVFDSFTVTQQITSVILFVIVFFHALKSTWTLSSLVSMAMGMLVVGYILIIWIDPTSDFYSIKDSLLHVILLFGTVYGLSPVLRTLTNSFSDDTIWALTFILLLAHLFFHDYGYTNNDCTVFNAPISLNAAIFASVLLSSRLHSNIHVFVLITFAIQMFALFPIVRHHIKRHSLEFHSGLTIGLCVACTVLLSHMSTLLTFIYIGIIGTITFVCPLWLIFIQKYKNEINGPWDEASVISQSGGEF
ncbi:hypothetical protein SAMD00019534_116670 [Acytostelium subglobosum LB1]|uniref:hypothetical protein n=1 Tax=Acytostelium subglobosum LB1 TaxID=1410327 RepID=UPI0006448E5A|nr:hypothetical protein SAMD00019534_116670 [Acytostelium subglobosum LB1]GAM28491.1 hypothetical protein SAMD00019534_116670 [Acytostelium subglobosum LB1]|eukprot:XP_012748530.1 hypothetical protein SAMD00019534_116670 [Acytostelium subglobosum LB1]